MTCHHIATAVRSWRPYAYYNLRRLKNLHEEYDCFVKSAGPGEYAQLCDIRHGWMCQSSCCWTVILCRDEAETNFSAGKQWHGKTPRGGFRESPKTV